MITAVSIYDRIKASCGDRYPESVLWEKAGIAEEILRLKREKNAVILTHFYIDQLLFHSVSDITGDSLELSRRASESSADIILVCGVSFMAETAKLLNPDKKVLCPVEHAGCSLAGSITAEDVRELKKLNPGVPVAAYINTYADLKAEIDICVTSGNAERIIGSMKNEKIIFLPDEFLAANIGKTTRRTGSEMIGWKGRCEVHERFTSRDIQRIREDHPGARILAHPECSPEVIELVDFSGGTSGMIDYIRGSSADEFCLLTEAAMVDNIRPRFRYKRFIPAPVYRCPHMEKITLENTLAALREERYEVEIPYDIRRRAAVSVARMLGE